MNCTAMAPWMRSTSGNSMIGTSCNNMAGMASSMAGTSNSVAGLASEIVPGATATKMPGEAGAAMPNGMSGAMMAVTDPVASQRYANEPLHVSHAVWECLARLGIHAPAEHAGPADIDKGSGAGP